MPKIITAKYTFIVIALFATLCLTVQAHAQSARKLTRKANETFQNKEYYSAAKLYAAVLYDSPLVSRTDSWVYPFQPHTRKHNRRVRQSERNYILYQLAESYRLYGHHKEALPQYEQYFSSQDTKFPLARLWYATCLLANDQPEKALTAFTAFLQKYKTKDAFAQKAKLGIADCNFAISNKSLPPKAIVTKLAQKDVADGSDFAMEKINDSIYWFTSSRHEVNKRKETIYPVRLYSGSFRNHTVEKVAGFTDTVMNMGTSSLSADGLTIYFTGWKEDKKYSTVNYHLFTATRNTVNDKWNTPVALPDPVNVAGFNSKQPFITRDNQFLFFVSERPGGYGKYDIWKVAMREGKPEGAAVNLGSNVNTDTDDVAPFYDAASGVLYYSSGGKTGMGGMDIYKVQGNPATNEWQDTAVNLGAPFNSSKDDLYYTKDSKSDTAYLSSDRASSCCLELFTAIRLPEKDTISKKTPVVLLEKPADPIVTKTTDKQLMDSINTVTVDRLHVNYHFASSKIRKADYPQLNTVIQMLQKDSTLNMLVASFTDCIGSKAANVRLSRKRSESVRAYLINKGIDKARINIDFFGKKHFVLACIEDSSYNQERQMANRRSDLIVTTEKNPKWRPSGNELDISKTVADSINKLIYTETTVASKNRYDNGKQGTVNAKVQDQINTNNSKQEAIRVNIPAGKNKSDSSNFNRDNNSSKKVSAYAGMLGNKNKPDSSNSNKVSYKNSDVKQPAISGGKKKDAVDANAKKKKPTSNNEDLFVKKAKRPVTEAYQRPVRKSVVDSSYKKMKITELLDLRPRLKKPDIIEEMTARTPRKSFEVYSESDSVRIDLYDNGVFDYDSVSVIYNKDLVIYKQILQTTKPISFYVKLNPDLRKNEMIFFAENLGLTPPNSALMIITDGDNKRTEINVSSDLEHNAVIYFIKVKKK